VQNGGVMRRAGWTAVAAVTVAAVAAVLFAPVLMRGEVFSFRDHSDYFQPLRFFTAQAMRQGVVPLWNPYNASGEPWLANPQTGVFYPPQWIFLLLPFPTAYVTFLALHALLLGWSAYRLFAHDGGEGAALFGAVSLMACGPALSLLDVQNNYCSFAFMPLLILLGIRRGEGRVSRAACGVVIALSFLAGEPFLAAVGAILFVSALLLTTMRGLPHGGRPLRLAAIDVALTAAMAAALAAVELLPFLSWVAGSDRAVSAASGELLRESMRPMDWLRLALPSGIGENLATASQQFIPSLYCGALVALFFLCGVVASVRNRWRRTVFSWLALLSVAIVAAAGRYLPLTGVLGAKLTLSRYPARLVPVGCLAVVGIAVVGLRWLASGHERLFRPAIMVGLAVAAALDLLPRAQPFLIHSRFVTDVVPYHAPVGRTAKLIRLPDESWRDHRLFDRRSWIGGYQNLFERRFDASTPAPLVPASYARLHDAALFTPRPDLLRLMSVGWMLTSRKVPASFLEPLQTRGAVTLYRFDSTLPFVQAWRRVSWAPSNEAALEALLDKPSQEALPVSGPAPRAGDVSHRPAGVSDRVDDVMIGLDEVRVRLQLASPRLVLVTQRQENGWTALVDGAEAPPLRAAGIFRAVFLSSGAHTVIWRYRPASLLFGALFTLCGLVWASLELLRRRAGSPDRHRESTAERCDESAAA
jgi:hypothetical protein